MLNSQTILPPCTPTRKLSQSKVLAVSTLIQPLATMIQLVPACSKAQSSGWVSLVERAKFCLAGAARTAQGLAGLSCTAVLLLTLSLAVLPQHTLAKDATSNTVKEQTQEELKRKGWLTQPAEPKPARTMTAEEQQLVELANARWRAIEKGDLQAAYEHLTPGSRAMITFERFAAEQKSAVVKQAQAYEAVCDSAGRCTVNLNAKAQLVAGRAGLNAIAFPLQEVWLKAQDGTFGLHYR